MNANPPVKHLWSNFWRLLKPYWVSKEGRKGWVLLLLILVLTGGSVYLAKAFNSWYNDFYNSIACNSRIPRPITRINGSPRISVCSSPIRLGCP